MRQPRVHTDSPRMGNQAVADGRFGEPDVRVLTSSEWGCSQSDRQCLKQVPLAGRGVKEDGDALHAAIEESQA
jgi:hypothetical protein